MHPKSIHAKLDYFIRHGASEEKKKVRLCRQLQILCVKVRTSYSQCLVLICLQLMNIYIDTFILVYFAHCSFSVLDIN